MNMHPKKNYAKVMLFGEYSLIVGSQALTIPFRKFSGTFRFLKESPLEIIEDPGRPQLQDSSLAPSSGKTATSGDASSSEKMGSFTFNAPKSAKHLRAFYEYLYGKKNDQIQVKGSAEQKQTDCFGELLRLDAFKSDLDKGMYFDSDIPNGSGVGSSGALVAAVYKRYALKPSRFSEASDINRLISILAAMESWFHGTSSGIDPLSCYINTGLLLDTGKRKAFRAIKAFPPLKGVFFLVDSQIVGETGPLVQAFLEKAESPGFRRFLTRQYVPVNNACIAALIDGDETLLNKSIRNISELQIHHFREMIPAELIDMWTYGLNSGAYSLKLCGSGGGGFFLGFTNNPGILNQSFPNHNWLQLSLPQ
jgi:mevalonate kinase